MAAGMQRILRKLDDRNVWEGKHVLRRRAYSYLHYSCAYMYGAAGNQKTALRNLLTSFAWYPFPYRRSEVRMALARPKTLVIILLRMLQMMRAEPQLSIWLALTKRSPESQRTRMAPLSPGVHHRTSPCGAATPPAHG